MGAAKAGRDVMLTGAHAALSVPLLAPRELSDMEAAPTLVCPTSSCCTADDAQCKLITCPAGEMVFPWMFEDFAALRPFKVRPAWPVDIASCGRMRPSLVHLMPHWKLDPADCAVLAFGTSAVSGRVLALHKAVDLLASQPGPHEAAQHHSAIESLAAEGW